MLSNFETLNRGIGGMKSAINHDSTGGLRHSSNHDKTTNSGLGPSSSNHEKTRGLGSGSNHDKPRGLQLSSSNHDLTNARKSSIGHDRSRGLVSNSNHDKSSVPIVDTFVRSPSRKAKAFQRPPGTSNTQNGVTERSKSLGHGKSTNTAPTAGSGNFLATVVKSASRRFLFDDSNQGNAVTTNDDSGPIRYSTVNEVDAKLSALVVSNHDRRRQRLRARDDEDLGTANSSTTNGTKVTSLFEILDEDKEIRSGDRVRFADLQESSEKYHRNRSIGSERSSASGSESKASRRDSDGKDSNSNEVPQKMRKEGSKVSRTGQMNATELVRNINDPILSSGIAQEGYINKDNSIQGKNSSDDGTPDHQSGEQDSKVSSRAPMNKLFTSTLRSWSSERNLFNNKQSKPELFDPLNNMPETEKSPNGRRRFLFAHTKKATIMEMHDSEPSLLVLSSNTDNVGDVNDSNMSRIKTTSRNSISTSTIDSETRSQETSTSSLRLSPKSSMNPVRKERKHSGKHTLVLEKESNEQVQVPLTEKNRSTKQTSVRSESNRKSDEPTASAITTNVDGAIAGNQKQGEQNDEVSTRLPVNKLLVSKSRGWSSDRNVFSNKSKTELSNPSTVTEVEKSPAGRVRYILSPSKKTKLKVDSGSKVSLNAEPSNKNNTEEMNELGTKRVKSAVTLHTSAAENQSSKNPITWEELDICSIPSSGVEAENRRSETGPQKDVLEDGRKDGVSLTQLSPNYARSKVRKEKMRLVKDLNELMEQRPTNDKRPGLGKKQVSVPANLVGLTASNENENEIHTRNHKMSKSKRGSNRRLNTIERQSNSQACLFLDDQSSKNTITLVELDTGAVPSSAVDSENRQSDTGIQNDGSSRAGEVYASRPPVSPKEGKSKLSKEKNVSTKHVSQVGNGSNEMREQRPRNDKRPVLGTKQMSVPANLSGFASNDDDDIYFRNHKMARSKGGSNRRLDVNERLNSSQKHISQSVPGTNDSCKNAITWEELDVSVGAIQQNEKTAVSQGSESQSSVGLASEPSSAVDDTRYESWKSSDFQTQTSFGVVISQGLSALTETTRKFVSKPQALGSLIRKKNSFSTNNTEYHDEVVNVTNKQSIYLRREEVLLTEADLPDLSSISKEKAATTNRKKTSRKSGNPSSNRPDDPDGGNYQGHDVKLVEKDVSENVDRDANRKARSQKSQKEKSSGTSHKPESSRRSGAPHNGERKKPSRGESTSKNSGRSGSDPALESGLGKSEITDQGNGASRQRDNKRTTREKHSSVAESSSELGNIDKSPCGAPDQYRDHKIGTVKEDSTSKKESSSNETNRNEVQSSDKKVGKTKKSDARTDELIRDDSNSDNIDGDKTSLDNHHEVDTDVGDTRQTNNFRSSRTNEQNRNLRLLDCRTSENTSVSDSSRAPKDRSKICDRSEPVLSASTNCFDGDYAACNLVTVETDHFDGGIPRPTEGERQDYLPVCDRSGAITIYDSSLVEKPRSKNDYKLTKSKNRVESGQDIIETNNFAVHNRQNAPKAERVASEVHASNVSHPNKQRENLSLPECGPSRDNNLMEHSRPIEVDQAFIAETDYHDKSGAKETDDSDHGRSTDESEDFCLPDYHPSEDQGAFNGVNPASQSDVEIGWTFIPSTVSSFVTNNNANKTVQPNSNQLSQKDISSSLSTSQNDSTSFKNFTEKLRADLKESNMTSELKRISENSGALTKNGPRSVVHRRASYSDGLSLSMAATASASTSFGSTSFSQKGRNRIVMRRHSLRPTSTHSIEVRVSKTPSIGIGQPDPRQSKVGTDSNDQSNSTVKTRPSKSKRSSNAESKQLSGTSGRTRTSRSRSQKRAIGSSTEKCDSTTAHKKNSNPQALAESFGVSLVSESFSNSVRW